MSADWFSVLFGPRWVVFDVRRLVSGVVWSPLGGSDHMHDSNIGCLVGVDGDLGFWWYV